MYVRQSLKARLNRIKTLADVTAIGIFDSGIGGLSLVEACEKTMPGTRILYVADTAHQPYGQKTAQQVVDYSRRICDFFQSHGVQAILVACSTASAVAVPVLQKSLRIPLLGLLNEGWVRDVLKKTRNRRIGILATTLTTQTGTFAEFLQQRAGEDVQVFGQAAPSLIGLISEGKLQEDVLMPVIRRDLCSLLDQGIDTLVVGCTHFNFILSQLEQVAGAHVKIVNPKDWATMEMAERLGWLSPSFGPTLPSPLRGEGKDEGSAFYATGDVPSFQALARKLWRPNVIFQPLEFVLA